MTSATVVARAARAAGEFSFKTNLKQVVPKNPQKYSTPDPQDIVHPFYQPSHHEQIDAVLSKDHALAVKLPMLRRVAPTWKSQLEFSEIKFSNSREAVHWFADSQTDVEKLQRINQHDLPNIVRIDTEGFAQRVKASLETRSSELLVSQIKALEGHFIDDIWLYILQKHITNEKSFNLVVDCLDTAKWSSNATEKVIHQVLLLSRQYSLAPESMERLLSGFTVEKPAILELLLEFYLKNDNLGQCKILLSQIINKGYLPHNTVLESYLELIQPEEKLVKFALVSDFRPVLESVITPKMASLLVTYVSSTRELFCLIDLIKKHPNKQAILQHIAPKLFISVEDSSLMQGIQTTMVLERLVKAGIAIDGKLLKYAVLEYARAGNFSALSKHWGSLEEDSWLDVFNNIKRGLRSREIPGFSRTHETVFYGRFINMKMAEVTKRAMIESMSNKDSLDAMYIHNSHLAGSFIRGYVNAKYSIGLTKALQDASNDELRYAKNVVTSEEISPLSKKSPDSLNRFMSV